MVPGLLKVIKEISVQDGKGTHSCLHLKALNIWALARYGGHDLYWAMPGQEVVLQGIQRFGDFWTFWDYNGIWPYTLQHHFFSHHASSFTPHIMLTYDWSSGFVQSLHLWDWILKLQLTALQGKRPCPLKPMHRSAVAWCFCTKSMFIHSFSTVLAANFGSHELLYITVPQTTWVGESNVVTL